MTHYNNNNSRDDFYGNQRGSDYDRRDREDYPRRDEGFDTEETQVIPVVSPNSSARYEDNRHKEPQQQSQQHHSYQSVGDAPITHYQKVVEDLATTKAYLDQRTEENTRLAQDNEDLEHSVEEAESAKKKAMIGIAVVSSLLVVSLGFLLFTQANHKQTETKADSQEVIQLRNDKEAAEKNVANLKTENDELKKRVSDSTVKDIDSDKAKRDLEAKNNDLQQQVKSLEQKAKDAENKPAQTITVTSTATTTVSSPSDSSYSGSSRGSR